MVAQLWFGALTFATCRANEPWEPAIWIEQECLDLTPWATVLSAIAI